MKGDFLCHIYTRKSAARLDALTIDSNDPSVKAMYTDLLLAHGQWQAASDLLQDDAANDVLLLRLAIAARQRGADAERFAAMYEERLRAARQRGDGDVHLREHARFMLFGLVHGFGFASVLGELGLNRANLAIGLIGFNLGVELGQLAVVSLLVPISFVFRTTHFYRAMLVPAGVVLIAILSTYWLAIRALGTSFA